MFVGLWPKKRAEMLVDDLKKLAVAFNTVEDPILMMKSRSVKSGVEGAIALTQLHGEEVDWEKVSSSRARPLSELLGFFEKAKKVCARYCINHHSFGGFFDFCAYLFDSCGKCFDASAKRRC
jgi:hypothetical protein